MNIQKLSVPLARKIALSVIRDHIGYNESYGNIYTVSTLKKAQEAIKDAHFINIIETALIVSDMMAVFNYRLNLMYNRKGE